MTIVWCLWLHCWKWNIIHVCRVFYCYLKLLYRTIELLFQIDEWSAHQGKKCWNNAPITSHDIKKHSPLQSYGGSVMNWDGCRWSHWGSATECAKIMRLAENLNLLNDKVIPSMGFLYPNGTGIFWDGNAKIHWAPTGEEQFRKLET